MNTDGWICGLLDSVSEQLLALEEAGLFASELRVSSEAYLSFAHLRQRELSDGVPLLVLGTAVSEDPGLAADEFALRR